MSWRLRCVLCGNRTLVVVALRFAFMAGGVWFAVCALSSVYVAYDERNK